MSSSLQIQQLAAGSVESNTNVLFDSVINLTGNISYDNATGIITLLEPGIYEFNWWIATQSSSSDAGLGFILASSQGDSIIGNSPIKTGGVVGIGIIEVTDVPITVELRNNSNTSVFYPNTVTIKASLTVICKDASLANEVIIPYSSGLSLITNADGTANLINLISFGSYSSTFFVDGQIDGLLNNMSFTVPRDGLIRFISGVVTIGRDLALGDSTLSITLQLYSASQSDRFFSPLPGTLLTLSPLLTGNVLEGSNLTVDSPELLVPVTRGTRLMLAYSASITDGSASSVSLLGYNSTGITIALSTFELQE